MTKERKWVLSFQRRHTINNSVIVIYDVLIFVMKLDFFFQALNSVLFVFWHLHFSIKQDLIHDMTFAYIVDVYYLSKGCT